MRRYEGTPILALQRERSLLLACSAHFHTVITYIFVPTCSSTIYCTCTTDPSCLPHKET
jgi:hypothetical protein